MNDKGQYIKDLTFILEVIENLTVDTEQNNWGPSYSIEKANKELAIVKLRRMIREETLKSRIEELKQQSINLIDEGWGGIGVEFDENKFAELIIQDCISILNQKYTGCKGEELLDRQIDDCVKEIKEHFGIER